MLWFLLTAYLCAGHYASGLGAGYNEANGIKSSVLGHFTVVLTWPIALFVTGGK